MRIANPKFNMPLPPPGSRPKRPLPPNSSGPKPIRPPKGGVMPMAMGGTVVKSRPTNSRPRPGEKPFSPGAKPFSPGMPKLPRIKMATGGMTLRPGDVTNKLPRASGGPNGRTNALPRVSGGPNGRTNALPRVPGMKSPMGMNHGGMAHGTKAKKGRGMAIMIAIGKPKGRGKS